MYEVLFQPSVSVLVDTGVIDNVQFDWADSIVHVYDTERDEAVQAVEVDSPELAARNLACQLFDDGALRLGIAQLIDKRLTELGLG